MNKSIIILFFIGVKLHAQNLVVNSSFESISTCGTQATLAVNWINPTQAGTPDLFNSCIPNWIPAHGSGISSFYQSPRTGSSYIGVFCYDRSGTNVREYMHSQLFNSLLVNNFYYIKFYIVLCNFAKNACNNMGMYFSNISIYQAGASNFLLNYFPQIKKFKNPIISDTLNWVEISGIYQANGSENYITIGNFNDDQTTDTSAFNPNNVYGAYYLLDDVSVEPITTPQWQYRDTTITLGDSVLIGPAITGLNVNWFTLGNTFIKNDPGIYVKPLITTKYKATETFNSVVYNHTVTVTVLPPNSVDEYEKLQSSINIFPNPGAGNFNIATFGLTDGELEISICDVTGKQVLHDKLNVVNALTKFNLDVRSGFYFVKITSNHKTVIKKLIVE